jgi:hypothetical protein
MGTHPGDMLRPDVGGDTARRPRSHRHSVSSLKETAVPDALVLDSTIFAGSTGTKVRCATRGETKRRAPRPSPSRVGRPSGLESSTTQPPTDGNRRLPAVDCVSGRFRELRGSNDFVCGSGDPECATEETPCLLSGLATGVGGYGRSVATIGAPQSHLAYLPFRRSRPPSPVEAAVRCLGVDPADAAAHVATLTRFDYGRT